MNLTEIEKAVNLLSSKHPGLTKELLNVLLEASGWEERHIKEAQIIFAAHLLSQNNNPALQNKAPKVSDQSITFITNDGREEGELVNLETQEDAGAPPVKKTPDIYSQVEEVPATTENKPIYNQESAPILKEEQDSFVKNEVAPSMSRKTNEDLPEDLPLIPFESSPHVWSFGRYKDTFHPEPKVLESVALQPKVETQKKEPEFIPYTPQKIDPPVVAAVIHQEQTTDEHVEIDLEKTPITKVDESLVVLAGIMLLAILLILGYMYGNGRL